MTKQTKLIFLCAPPASGKSTYSKELAEKENAIVLSSDQLRIELFQNIDDIEHNSQVFAELKRRAKSYLQEGRSVIIDATNISAKRRMGFLKEFEKVIKEYGIYKECHYISTPYDQCLKNNREREYKLLDFVITRMYKGLNVPIYQEGWDEIIVYSYQNKKEEYREKLEKLILKGKDYDTLYKELMNFSSEFTKTYEIGQDTPYHVFSISRHIYYVYKNMFDYIKEQEEKNLKQYTKEERLELLWACLLHDIGKSFCKNFKSKKDKNELSRYANFINHDNVSAQIAVVLLYQLGYDTDFILKTTSIINYHMRLTWQDKQITDQQKIESIKADNKLLKFVGKDLFDKLKIFRIMDENAK